MKYKIKDICSTLGLGVSKFYKLKYVLDNSILEDDKIEYYFTEGRNFYITDKGFDWFKNNLNNISKSQSVKNNITIYQNQIIEMYKQENEYLKQENKRLLDIISVKEQKELATDIKYINNCASVSFWDKLFAKFKK